MSDSILVTGVTGFVGSALAARLIADGHRVSGLVRRGSPRRSRAAIPDLEVLEIVNFSVAELDRALGAHRFDAVCHLASYGVAAGETDTAELISGNVVATASLVEVAAARSVRRFLHTGSCFEYAAGSPGVPLSEAAPIRPWSVYGAAKAGSVHLARTLAAKHSLPLAVLRLFAVYGPGEHPRRLVPYLIDRLRRREPAELTAGLQVRDFLHVDDAVEAFRAALATPNLPLDGADYNVCSGMPTTVRELGEVAADLLGASGDLLHWGVKPTRAEEPPWIVGDSSAFRAATGWSPRFDLREGLRATIKARNHA